eukprot:3528776-Amphidinium_carterae.1
MGVLTRRTLCDKSDMGCDSAKWLRQLSQTHKQGGKILGKGFSVASICMHLSVGSSTRIVSKSATMLSKSCRSSMKSSKWKATACQMSIQETQRHTHSTNDFIDLHDRGGLPFVSALFSAFLRTSIRVEIVGLMGGTFDGQRLNCNRRAREKGCVQLNCYSTHPDKESPQRRTKTVSLDSMHVR